MAKYYLGKCDYFNHGRKDRKAYIVWTLQDGRFAMQAEVWNGPETDILVGGQCVAEVAAFFPHDSKAQRMLAIWRRWHLNHMQAGTPRQMAFLCEHPQASYDAALAALAMAGLNPDPETGYRYGSAWLREELPGDVEAEITSWNE